MYMEKTEIIHQPADEVYPLVRDEMEKLVPFIPNVEKIEMVSREQVSDTKTKIVNHWYSKAEVPSALKSVVKPELFQWKDYALWDDDEYCVDFEIESFYANKLYDLSGRNCFKPHGDGKTQLMVSFNLEIYPENLPGVPKFVAKRLKGTIEQFVKRLLTPNLNSLAKGLTDYFDSLKKR